MPKIIAFSGSPSSDSINQATVKAVVRCFDSIDVEVIDLRDYPAVFYSRDEERLHGVPENIVRLREKLNEANGYVVASPEYNGSMPAFFKNTIDWLTRLPVKVFDGKPVLLLSASPGSNGGATNLATLAKLVPWWGADLVGTYSIGKFKQVYGDDGFAEHIQRELASWAIRLETRVNERLSE